MVDHYKSEYLVKISASCVQGLGHSKASKFQGIFVWTDRISRTTELFVTKPGDGVVMHPISQHAIQKDCFAIFKVKVTARAPKIKI